MITVVIPCASWWFSGNVAASGCEWDARGCFAYCIGPFHIIKSFNQLPSCISSEKKRAKHVTGEVYNSFVIAKLIFKEKTMRYNFVLKSRGVYGKYYVARIVFTIAIGQAQHRNYAI